MHSTPTIPDPDDERRRQTAYRRLGSTEPRCIVCGEDDWRCLELHHIAGHTFDDQAVILCRNCHRKQSDPTANTIDPIAPPIMDRAGHLLLGLAQFLAELVARLRTYGQQLLDGAPLCPWPYGWVGAPSVAS